MRVRVLTALAETAVVTLAGGGAVAFSRGDTVALRIPENVEDPVDTTGAGDLLAAAYIWADLRGAAPADCLRPAVLYATLAVNTPTGIGGAVTEAAGARSRSSPRSDASAAGRRRSCRRPTPARQPRKPRAEANDLLSTRGRPPSTIRADPVTNADSSEGEERARISRPRARCPSAGAVKHARTSRRNALGRRPPQGRGP